MRSQTLLFFALCTPIAAGLSMPADAQQRNGATPPPAKRLYRWVDPSGKVHYTDALPAEAVDQARSELSAASGLVQEQVDRALTAEEREAQATAAATAAQTAEQVERRRRADEAKIASFQTEEQLVAAFEQRKTMLDETLMGLDAGVDAQIAALADTLSRAGEDELAGRPVRDTLATSIADQRQEILNQEAVRTKRAAERAALDGELTHLRTLFRERQARIFGQPAATPDSTP